ncbi:MAG: Hsp20 family protein [Cyclobacteriaceae bacterium]
MKFIDLKKYVNQLELLNTLSGGVAMTSINIDQLPNKIMIKAQAPTVPSEAYDIVINDNKLILYSATQNKDKALPLFEQIFDIPSFVNKDAISADAEDGHIVIHMPFKEGEKLRPRRINIRHTN